MSVRCSRGVVVCFGAHVPIRGGKLDGRAGGTNSAHEDALRSRREGLEFMDEQALVAAARAGNPHAFNALVHTYQDIAYNVAYRVLGQTEAAADATQEAFLSAYRALPAFRGGSFKAWLLRIVTNACYDQMRLRKRRPQTSLDDLVEDSEYAISLIDHSESPEETVMRQDLAQTLEAGIARLPADQRMTLVLSDVQGLSYEEISAITGASLGTVKSRLSRARARLRDYLTAEREPWAP